MTLPIRQRSPPRIYGTFQRRPALQTSLLNTTIFESRSPSSDVTEDTNRFENYKRRRADAVTMPESNRRTPIDSPIVRTYSARELDAAHNLIRLAATREAIGHIAFKPQQGRDDEDSAEPQSSGSEECDQRCEQDREVSAEDKAVMEEIRARRQRYALRYGERV